MRFLNIIHGKAIEYAENLVDMAYSQNLKKICSKLTLILILKKILGLNVEFGLNKMRSLKSLTFYSSISKKFSFSEE